MTETLTEVLRLIELHRSTDKNSYLGDAIKVIQDALATPEVVENPEAPVVILATLEAVKTLEASADPEAV